MNNQDIVSILNNLGFEKVADSKFGDVVTMNCEDAYLFSLVTGSSYLFSNNGFTPKSCYEVFIHRSIFQENNYIYSPGLFNRDMDINLTEGNSFNYLNLIYPKLFNGDKKIIITNIKKGNSSNIEREYFDLISKSDDPTDYLLFKNFQTGSSLEPFFEYLASKLFIAKGYLVENQTPWFQQAYKYKGELLNGGIPDFSYFSTSIVDNLKAYGILGESGLHIGMLPVIKAFREVKNNTPDNTLSYYLGICEVKSSRSSIKAAVNQLTKYGKTELPNSLGIIIPDLNESDLINNSDFDKFYINKNRLEYLKSKSNLSINRDSQKIDEKWINDYIKILLLGNLKFSDIIDFLEEHRKVNKLEAIKKYGAQHLLDAIITTDDDVFFDYLIKNI
jgi:hypothetical protein